MFFPGESVLTLHEYEGQRRLGVVVSRDCGYVYVRLLYAGVVAECYDSELLPVSGSDVVTLH